MPFMTAEILPVKQPGYEVTTTAGVSYLPVDVVGQCWGSEEEVSEHVRDYVEGAVLEVSRVVGWFGRYSAAGYLDCTDWLMCDTRDELVAELNELYGVGDELGEEDCD